MDGSSLPPADQQQPANNHPATSGKTLPDVQNQAKRQAAAKKLATAKKAAATRKLRGGKAFKNLYGDRTVIRKPAPRQGKRRVRADCKLIGVYSNVVNALQEIRHYQKQAGTIFPRAAFMRLVKEILGDIARTATHVSASAHACLQHCSEAYIVTFFELMYDIQLITC
jgi:histone H3/H4